MIGSQVNMEPRMTQPRRRVRRGCLFWSIVLIAGVAGLVLVFMEQGRRQLRELQLDQALEQARWRAESVEIVKSGDDGGRISIFDAELARMLASDPQCI